MFIVNWMQYAECCTMVDGDDDNYDDVDDGKNNNYDAVPIKKEF